MKKVQHTMSATKSNTTKGARWKKVQHGKSATWKEPTQKKYSMSRFQHEATSKKNWTRRKQREKSLPREKYNTKNV